MPNINFTILIILDIWLSNIKYIHTTVQLSPPSTSRDLFTYWDSVLNK